MSTDNIEQSLQHILSALSQWDSPNLPDLIRHMATIHMMQANVIQGERALREAAEIELLLFRRMDAGDAVETARVIAHEHEVDNLDGFGNITIGMIQRMLATAVQIGFAKGQEATQ